MNLSLSKDEEKLAKMIFKRLKACAFDVSVLKERFDLTKEEKDSFNKKYAWKYGNI